MAAPHEIDRRQGLKSPAAALWLVLAASASAQPAAFTDVTAGDLLRAASDGRGAAWTDVDSDGLDDIYLTNWQAPARLFRNFGGGVFKERTSGLPTRPHPGDIDGDGFTSASDLAQVLGSWGTAHEAADLNDDGVVGAHDLAAVLGDWDPAPATALQYPGSLQCGRSAWADYDDDGRVDVFVAASDGSALLHNVGSIRFLDVTSPSLEMNGKICRGAAWADYDGDGDADLYVSAHEGGDSANALFRNNGLSFTNVAAGAIADIGVGRGVAWCDYDNDGDQDLYLCNGLPGPETGDPALVRNHLFRNEGAGAFVDVPSATLQNEGNSRGCAWGDYDNDGDFDLYVSNLKVNGVGGDNVLLRNDGADVFTDVTHGQLNDASQTRDCAWIDFDNDGDLDLFIVNAGVNHKLFRNDAGVFTSIDAGPLTANTEDANASAWADYDGDGDLDGYVARAQALSLLVRNDLANGNHWLQARLRGTASNRSAIGARVTVTTGSLTQIREVQAGSGYLAQHSLVLHFGLGGAGVVDALEIRWPSGLVETYEDVVADQILHLVEGAL